MKSLSCLLKCLKVLQRTSGEDVNVHRIQFDSRKVEAGDLFVAERGEVSDGHNYINAAIAKGAVVVVVEDMPVELNDGVVYLQVENSRQAMGIIARNFYDNPSSKLKLIGVTGTNGKTTIATLSYNLFMYIDFADLYLLSVIFFQHKKAI